MLILPFFIKLHPWEPHSRWGDVSLERWTPANEGGNGEGHRFAAPSNVTDPEHWWMVPPQMRERDRLSVYTSTTSMRHAEIWPLTDDATVNFSGVIVALWLYLYNFFLCLEIHAEIFTDESISWVCFKRIWEWWGNRWNKTGLQVITVKADGYMGVHYMGWGFLHLFEILHSKQIRVISFLFGFVFCILKRNK